MKMNRPVTAAFFLSLCGAAMAQDWNGGDRGDANASLTRAQYLTAQEVRFTRLDSDANGIVTSAEFSASAQSSGRGDWSGRGGGSRRMSRADTNADGLITKVEFQANALQRFARLDADGDGVVTPMERRASWQNWQGRGSE